ncbi:uncharacterized protein [Physcomitrium patens]|uniref:uncharacterized protein n=1 Tax=Physcomitrium patens TaxID=3218 RepID=UPI003CCC9477
MRQELLIMRDYRKLVLCLSKNILNKNKRLPHRPNPCPNGNGSRGGPTVVRQDPLTPNARGLLQESGKEASVTSSGALCRVALRSDPNARDGRQDYCSGGGLDHSIKDQLLPRSFMSPFCEFIVHLISFDLIQESSGVHLLHAGACSEWDESRIKGEIGRISHRRLNDDLKDIALLSASPNSVTSWVNLSSGSVFRRILSIEHDCLHAESFMKEGLIEEDCKSSCSDERGDPKFETIS